MYGHEKSDLCHRSCEADEQSGTIRRGVGRPKGRDRGQYEQLRTRRTPSRLSVAQDVGSSTASHCRQTLGYAVEKVSSILKVGSDHSFDYALA